MSIGCIFSGADIPIVLDATSITNLKEEYLLNSNGKLEIYRVFAKVRDLAAFKLNVWLPQQKARNLYLLKK